MQKKTIKNYTKDAVKTMRSYDATGTKKWDAKTALFDMPVQVGSLVKAFMQYDNMRFANGATKKELKEKMSDELADIFTEVLFVARELDIDIEQAFETMLTSDKTKVKARSKKNGRN